MLLAAQGVPADLLIRIVERANLLEVASNFAGNVLATTLRGESLYDLDLSQPTAIAIGNEGSGLSDGMMKASTHQVTIPIAAGVESLNAAAAASVCLFERVRQTG